MCEHLQHLENYLIQHNIKETYRGQAWGDNCGDWIYYDCYLDIKQLQKRFNFPSFIKHHTNNDERSGLEEGFVCELCKDAIMGHNSKFKHKFKSLENKQIIK